MTRQTAQTNAPEAPQDQTFGPYVRLSVRSDGTAALRFERPEGRNSFDVDTLDDLLEAVRATVRDDRVRAVTVTGTEPFFCTGADVKEMQAQAERAAAHFDDLTLRYHAMLALMQQSDTVFVGALRGVAAGGGVGLALACDLLVVGESSRLMMAYGNLGVSPDGGATAHLVRRAGPHRAREAILVDDGIDAPQMSSWGLVNRVVPDADVVPAATALAQVAAGRSAHTRRWTKHLVEEAATKGMGEMLEAERRAIIEAAGTPDFSEGLAAFLNKRKPDFH